MGGLNLTLLKEEVGKRKNWEMFIKNVPRKGKESTMKLKWGPGKRLSGTEEFQV